MNTNPSIPATSPASSEMFGWLTPRRCRMIFVLLLIGGVFAQWWYLARVCPIDLSGDEAQYWDWSRNLDWSYYSKGPAIAFIVRFGCWLLGEQSMVAVRFPATLLAAGSAIGLWGLVLRLFRSHRLALGTVLMACTIPVAVVGSVSMTIDAPLIFCWIMATWLAAVALGLGPSRPMDHAHQREIPHRPPSVWPWIGMGVLVGLGFLAKYAMLLWYVGLLLFVLFDRRERRRGLWPRFALALTISLALTFPFFWWNSQHGWVSFFHVKTQTGTGFKLTNPPEFLAIQIFLVVGLGYTFVLLGAVGYAIRNWRERAASPLSPAGDTRTREMLFLLCIGGAFGAITSADSLFTKVQPNWPIPGYITLLVLGAYFMSRRLVPDAPHRRFWLANLIITVTCGLAVLPFVYDSAKLLPAISWANATFKPKRPIRDPLYKLRGWRILGPIVAGYQAGSSPGAFILADDYQMTAQLAFYIPGQPRTFCAGPYYQNHPSRHSQYDIWPDRALDRGRTTLIGRDAIFVGKEDNPNPELFGAFESSEELPPVAVVVAGQTVRTFRLWRLHDFKGFAPLKQSGRF